MRLLGTLLAMMTLAPACALSRQENRPLLDALDQALPEADGSAESIALGVATLPVAIPAGIVDTFLAHPALEVDSAARDTSALLWENPQGAAFYQAAIFLPKVVATPFVFLGDWCGRSIFPVDRNRGED